MENMGLLLKKELFERDLSVGYVAEKADVSKAYIYTLMTKEVITLPTWEKLAEIVGFNPAICFGVTHENQQPNLYLRLKAENEKLKELLKEKERLVQVLLDKKS